MLSLKAVLFDRDETLCITDLTVYQEAAAWMEAEWGLPAQLALKTLAQYWQEKSQDWWHLRSHADETAFWNDYAEELALKLGISGAQAQQLSDRYPYEAYLKAVPNARSVLLKLRERGYRIGVLSNTLPSIDRTLIAIGLNDLVDVALATCLLGVHKPEHEAFRLAAREMNLPPHEILFVDDRQENVDAARQVGMQAHMIDLHGKQPHALHSLEELLTLPELNGIEELSG